MIAKPTFHLYFKKVDLGYKIDVEVEDTGETFSYIETDAEIVKSIDTEDDRDLLMKLIVSKASNNKY